MAPAFFSDNSVSFSNPPGSDALHLTDTMDSPLLGFPMDYHIRDSYPPSEDGQTPPFSDLSDFPSPLQHVIADEFPGFPNFHPDHFDRLRIGVPDTFHPCKNSPPSPQPVIAFDTPSHYPMQCDSRYERVAQATDLFSSPDDLQEVLQMAEQPIANGIDFPSRQRRWSFGENENDDRRYHPPYNSPASSVSRSLDHDSLTPAHAQRASQYNNLPSIDPSINLEIYNQQSPRFRTSHLVTSSPENYSAHPHVFQGLAAHAEGLSHHRSLQLSAPSPAQATMIKPQVTSRAVRNASNSRIRHEAKHSCQYCPERFTTSGNLRNHTNSHFGIKPYRCPQPGCGREFVTKSDCKRHQGKVHRDEDFPPSH